LAHIDGMARQAQQSTRIDEILRLQQTRLATAKKALTLNPDERTKQRLIMAIYEIYSGLVRAGVPSARAQLTEFAKTLVRDKDPEVARFGRHLMFDANLTRLLNEPTTDAKAMQAEVDSLLAAEKGALTVETLELASQAAELLMQNGHSEDAAKVMESLATAAHEDPNLADAASRYSDRAVMIRADLSNLLTQMLGGDKAAEQKVLDAVARLLTQVKPSGEVLRNMRDVAMLLEYSGNLQAADAAYKQIEAAFAAAGDPALVEGAQNIVASARKRLALVGQPFVVEGVTLDGKPFDWTPYVGKVVLVDFWATWCGPCLEELPNIRQTFDEYHARGFEVVGVNLNTKISDVRDFFAVQELPWQTLTDSSVLQGAVDDDWTKLPMAAKSGVDAIPFLVLIGKDGKVNSIHVKGPKLKARLAQLLGEPTKAEVPPDPTAPAAPVATPSATPSAGGQEK
jgi:thiol-disulfide isomerase/thioredoxin